MNDDENSQVRENVRRVKTGGNERIVRKVKRKEIMSALKKIKSGKAAGM